MTTTAVTLSLISQRFKATLLIFVSGWTKSNQNSINKKQDFHSLPHLTLIVFWFSLSGSPYFCILEQAFTTSSSHLFALTKSVQYRVHKHIQKNTQNTLSKPIGILEIVIACDQCIISIDNRVVPKGLCLIIIIQNLSGIVVCQARSQGIDGNAMDLVYPECCHICIVNWWTFIEMFVAARLQ